MAKDIDNMQYYREEKCWGGRCARWAMRRRVPTIAFVKKFRKRV